MVQVFIEAKNPNTSEYQFIEYVLDLWNIKINKSDIIPVNGKDNLKKFVNQFTTGTLWDKKNIVIFDADSIDKNGGFVQRKQELENFKQQNKIDFDLFLWPNNHDDGTFEDVLLHSVKDEHQHILECFDKFENCIRQYNKTYSYAFPNNKSKIYTYKELLQGHKDANDWQFGNKKYWNFNNDYIKALKDFLLQYK